MSKPSLIERTNKLSAQMNELTSKIINNIEVAEQMQVTSEDLITEIKTEYNLTDLTETSDSPDLPELVNLKNLLDDFYFIRETLNENTTNGRKIANLIASIILDSSEEVTTELVNSFTSINDSITKNMDLFLKSYKEISNVVINLEKIKSGKLTPQNNTLNVNVKTSDERQIKSTAEIIKELESLKPDDQTSLQ